MALAIAPSDTMSEEEDWEKEEEGWKGVPSLVTLAGRKVFTMGGVREIFKAAGIEGFYDRLRRNHILNYFQNVTLFWKEFNVEDLDCDLANEYDDQLRLCGDGFTVWFYDVEHAPPQPPRHSAPCSLRFTRWQADARFCARLLLSDGCLVYSFSVYNEEWISETYGGYLVIDPGGEINVYDQRRNRLEMDGYVTNRYDDEDRLYVRDIVKFVRLV